MGIKFNFEVGKYLPSFKVWGCAVKVDNARLKRKAVPSSEIHLNDLNAFSATGLNLRLAITRVGSLRNDHAKVYCS